MKKDLKNSSKTGNQKLIKRELLSVKEKIDLFIEFMKENPDKKIRNNTTFKGHSIGYYLQHIRQAILYKKRNVIVSPEEQERLESLGLLSDEKDKIEAKVERLIEFCKRCPYAFSKFAEFKKRLEKEGKKEEAEYLEKLHQEDYLYITNRRVMGALNEEMQERLKKAKIGGVFGLLKEDEEFIKKYNIKDIVMIALLQDFGTIDEFRKAYIQYRVELSNAKNYMEIDKINKENINILKYTRDLPLVVDFYFIENKKYSQLLSVVGGKLESGSVFAKGADDLISNILEQLPKRDKEIIELRFGIKEGKSKTLREIGKIFNLNSERIRQIEASTLHRIRNIIFQRKNGGLVFNANEEFIRSYFEMQDIFFSEEKTNMKQEDIDKLIGFCKKNRGEQREKIAAENDLHAELSTRASCALRNCGYTTVQELVEGIQTPKELYKIKNLGIKSIQEIIDRVHALGYGFKWENKTILLGYKENEETRDSSNSKMIYIKEISLSTRARNALTLQGYSTINKLVECIETPQDLYKIRSLGIKTIHEIIDKVHELGYKFKWEKKDNVNTKESEIDFGNKNNVQSQTDTNQQGLEKSQCFGTERNEQIIELDTKYIELCREVSDLNAKKEHLKQRINDILRESETEILDPIGRDVMEQFTNLLQEQRRSLEEIDKLIVRMTDLVKANRERRMQLMKKFEKVQGEK